MSGTSFTGQLIAHLLAHPGQRVATIADTFGKTRPQIRAMLMYLASHQWVYSRSERRYGQGGRPEMSWYPTEKAKTTPYVEPVPSDTQDRVLEALQNGGALTLADIARSVDRPYESIRRALRTLASRGTIEKLYGPDGASYAVPLDDDGWSPPTTYISASRAYALGLR